jgi:hypothetical protein
LFPIYCRIPKLDVAGSIPVSRSILFNHLQKPPKDVGEWRTLLNRFGSVNAVSALGCEEQKELTQRR